MGVQDQDGDQMSTPWIRGNTIVIVVEEWYKYLTCINMCIFRLDLFLAWYNGNDYSLILKYVILITIFPVIRLTKKHLILATLHCAAETKSPCKGSTMRKDFLLTTYIYHCIRIYINLRVNTIQNYRSSSQDRQCQALISLLNSLFVGILRMVMVSPIH